MLQQWRSYGMHDVQRCSKEQLSLDIVSSTTSPVCCDDDGVSGTVSQPPPDATTRFGRRSLQPLQQPDDSDAESRDDKASSWFCEKQNQNKTKHDW